MMVPPPPAPLFPGGEYELDGLLGTGGMAVVYRARDVRRARTVAMKVLRPEVAHVVGAERFRREIAVVSGLSHPNILPLLDSGETSTEDGHPAPFYVMPLIEGDTLAQCIEREGRLSVSDAFRITREILDAVEYAHAHGVLHRDIKPGNVLLSATHAVVADFGLAHLIPSSDLALDGAGRITVSGVAVGTPAYMSPEQALGDKHVDERTDLFALGCVLYEMLTGVTPFDAPTAQSIISRKMNGMFIPVSVMRPGAPAGIDELMRQALAPEPADRFATAESFRRAIEGLEQVSRSGPAAAVTANASPSRRTVPLWTLMAGFTLIVVVLLWLLKPPEPAPPPVKTAEQPLSGRESVAILPLELAVPDSELSIMASGLAMDLIDELSRYPALKVISWNGVRGFAGRPIAPDSIARALGVRSVVTGVVERSGDTVHVAMRLIDGPSSVQRSTVEARGTLSDVLGIRAQVLDSLSHHLRVAIGQRVGEQRRGGASNAEAWALVAEARSLITTELRTRSASWPVNDRVRRFAEAERMLDRAAELDQSWSTPYAVASRLLLLHGDLEEVASFTQRARPVLNTVGGEGVRLSPSASYRLRGLAYAEQALARNPDDAEALHMRGRARMKLWEHSHAEAADTLASAALLDLRRAVELREDMAGAWNDLSVLLELQGELEGAYIAADSALLADAYLERPQSVVNRLAFTSMAHGHVEVSRRWCKRGQRDYPNEPSFWGCELTILGWNAKTASAVDSAWRLLRESEARDSLDRLAMGWGTRRLLVAAIAARAGLPDSARRIIAKVRDRPATETASLHTDYTEAYVRTLLGDTDMAIDILARFLNAYPSMKRNVRTMPWFSALRDDDRFIAITSLQ